MAKLVTSACGRALLRPLTRWRGALAFVSLATVLLCANAQDLYIKEVWIVPLSHTDFGFTD